MLVPTRTDDIMDIETCRSVSEVRFKSVNDHNDCWH